MSVILCVESSAPVIVMELAARSTAGVPRVARIDLGDATVPRVSVEVVNVHVLLLGVSVIQMCVEIAGLAVEMAHLANHQQEEMVISAAI